MHFRKCKTWEDVRIKGGGKGRLTSWQREWKAIDHEPYDHVSACDGAEEETEQAAEFEGAVNDVFSAGEEVSIR